MRWKNACSRAAVTAEAIAAYVEQEEWQPGEIRAAIDELDAGHGVSHEKVAAGYPSPDAIREFIEKNSDQNAAQTVERILYAIEILATQPQMGRPRRLTGTRELVISGTPHVVP